jgi:hypothetical protein
MPTSRPRGKGLHVVRLAGVGVEVIVGSIAGSLTYSPGELVHIGSRSGRRNPVILGLPPAGARAAGVVPLSEFSAEDSVPVIYAAHPDTVPAGSTDYRIVLVGRSLSSAPLDYFEAVLWDEEAAAVIVDPLVLVHDPAYIADPSIEGLELEAGEDAVAVLVDGNRMVRN